MNMKTKLLVAIPLALFGMTAIACYAIFSGPVYGDIEGRVSRGGVPLEHVEVVFFPEQNGSRSVGLTDKDGRFETTTDGIQNHPAHQGALVGKYRVVLIDRHAHILAMEEQAWATIRADEKNPVAAGLARPEPQVRPEQKTKVSRSSAMRVSERYNKRSDTPFTEIEIKPGKNTFEFEVE